MRLLNWGVVAVAAIAFAGPAAAQDSDPALNRDRGFVMSGATILPPVYKHNGHVANFTREVAAQSGGGYWCSSCPNAQRCNNYAGSFKADLGFAVGPTASFFSPCGPRILPDCGAFGRGGCGAFGGGCQSCPRTQIYGRGPAAPWSHCTYDSYLNH
jgi:hypothetical protein